MSEHFFFWLFLFFCLLLYQLSLFCKPVSFCLLPLVPVCYFSKAIDCVDCAFAKLCCFLLRDVALRLLSNRYQPRGVHSPNRVTSIYIQTSKRSRKQQRCANNQSPRVSCLHDTFSIHLSYLSFFLLRSVLYHGVFCQVRT